MDSEQLALGSNVDDPEGWDLQPEITSGQVTLASIIFDAYRMQIVGWKEARGWLASVFPAYAAVKDDEFEKDELARPANYERDGLDDYYRLDHDPLP